MRGSLSLTPYDDKNSMIYSSTCTLGYPHISLQRGENSSQQTTQIRIQNKRSSTHCRQHMHKHTKNKQTNRKQTHAHIQCTHTNSTSHLDPSSVMDPVSQRFGRVSISAVIARTLQLPRTRRITNVSTQQWLNYVLHYFHFNNPC